VGGDAIGKDERLLWAGKIGQKSSREIIREVRKLQQKECREDLRVLLMTIRRQPQVAHELIKALTECNDLNSVRSYLESTPQAKICDWNQLLFATARTEGLEATEELVDRIKRHGLALNAESFRALVVAGKPISKVDEEMQRLGLVQDLNHLETVLVRYGEMADVRAAEERLRTAIKEGRARPRSETLSAVVFAQLMADQVDGALRTLVRMKKEGFGLSSFVLRKLPVDRAKRLFSLQVQMGLHNVDACRTVLIRRLLEAAEYQMVLNVPCHTDPRAHLLRLVAAVRLQNSQVLSRVMQQSLIYLRLGEEIDRLVVEMVSCKFIENAEELLRRARGRQLVPSTGSLEQLIAGYASAGRLQDAERHLTTLELEAGYSPSPVILQALIGGHQSEGNHDRVLEYWERMPTLNRDSKDVMASRTVESAISSLLKLGNSRRALDVCSQSFEANIPIADTVKGKALLQALLDGQSDQAHGVLKSFRTFFERRSVAIADVLLARSKRDQWRMIAEHAAHLDDLRFLFLSVHIEEEYGAVVHKYLSLPMHARCLARAFAGRYKD